MTEPSHRRPCGRCVGKLSEVAADELLRHLSNVRGEARLCWSSGRAATNEDVRGHFYELAEGLRQTSIALGEALRVLGVPGVPVDLVLDVPSIGAPHGAR
jgi:hypothetical protein